MSDRLLVTGATGFLGRWVLRHWRQAHEDVELWATSEQPPPDDRPADAYRQVDLHDAAAVRELVEECRPAQVLHLAARIVAPELDDLLAVNVEGTRHLYDALCQASIEDLRVVQVGSAALYGPIEEGDLPIAEAQPLRAVTPYAVSKARQDELAGEMHERLGLPVIRARVFNMLGPGQGDTLVPMTFVRQFRDIQAGRASEIKTGDTSTRRDFVDVRDVVAALDALLQRGLPGAAYNVASGRDVSIQEVLDELRRISGVDAPVVRAADRLRTHDTPRVQADVSAIARATAWRAKISLATSLADMWDGGSII